VPLSRQKRTILAFSLVSKILSRESRLSLQPQNLWNVGDEKETHIYMHNLIKTHNLNTYVSENSIWLLLRIHSYFPDLKQYRRSIIRAVNVIFRFGSKRLLNWWLLPTFLCWLVKPFYQLGVSSQMVLPFISSDFIALVIFSVRVNRRGFLLNKMPSEKEGLKLLFQMASCSGSFST
jgi:hypothetical protein